MSFASSPRLYGSRTGVNINGQMQLVYKQCHMSAAYLWAITLPVETVSTLHAQQSSPADAVTAQHAAYRIRKHVEIMGYYTSASRQDPTDYARVKTNYASLYTVLCSANSVVSCHAFYPDVLLNVIYRNVSCQVLSCTYSQV